MLGFVGFSGLVGQLFLQLCNARRAPTQRGWQTMRVWWASWSCSSAMHAALLRKGGSRQCRAHALSRAQEQGTRTPLLVSTPCFLVQGLLGAS